MKQHSLPLIVILLLAEARCGAAAMHDSSFEAIPPGRLAPAAPVTGWQVQCTGRDAIKPRLVAAGIENQARTGSRCLSLSIPADTKGFEFVTVGQLVRLNPTNTYQASVWVRWPDGPDTPPADASATSGHRSAIVSFWARHRAGAGDFAGRDEWLFDNQWHRLTFRFRATDAEQATLVYVSLLPNQKPAATTVLVDDFELAEFPEVAEIESRDGELVLDSDFAKQSPGTLAPPWYFANMGGTGISGKIVGSGEQQHFTLAMGQATSNFESAQLWQHLALRQGVRYEVSCRMRWDNFAAAAPAPIVNYGIYHEATRTWYGPVDQVLEPTAEWRTYRFTHVPPDAGPWKLYVQINGWGNFGHGVTVSVDDLSCRANK
jgi:hypothetical protein